MELRGGKIYLNRNSGFTLIELIVSMIIFSFIATVAYMSFKSGRDATVKAKRYAKLNQAARIAMNFITKDLYAMFETESDFNYSFTGTDDTYEEKMADSITFTTTSNSQKSDREKFEQQKRTFGDYVEDEDRDRECDIQHIAYYIDNDEETEQEGLCKMKKSKITLVYSEDEEEFETIQLVKEVTELNLRYYDEVDWLDNWDAEVSESLPKSIEIKIVVTLNKDSEVEGEKLTKTFVKQIYFPIGLGKTELRGGRK